MSTNTPDSRSDQSVPDLTQADPDGTNLTIPQSMVEDYGQSGDADAQPRQRKSGQSQSQRKSQGKSDDAPGQNKSETKK